MTPTGSAASPSEHDIAALKARISTLEAELAQLRGRDMENGSPHPAAPPLDSVSDAVFLLDREYRCLWLNAAAERMLGMERGDLIGRVTWDVFPDARDGPFHDCCVRALRTQLPEEFTSYFETWGRWYDNRVYPNPNGLLLYLRDITAQKNAEARLRESAALNQFLLRLSDALRPLSDPAEIQRTASRLLGEQLRASRVLYSEIEGEEAVVRGDYVDGLPSIAGRHRLAALGELILEAHRRGDTVSLADIPNHPNLPQPVRDTFAAIGAAAHLSVGLLKDGHWIAALTAQQATPRVWTLAEASLLRETAERTWEAFSFVAEEATSRKRGEERELAAVAKFRTVFHQSGIFAAILGLDGTILEANDWAVDGCGFSRSQAAGRPLWEAPWWEKSDRSRDRIRFAVEQGAAGRPTREALGYCVAGGAERWLDFSLHPVRDEAGTVVFLNPTGIDITERLKAESALHLSEERLLLAKRAAGLGIHDYRPRTGEIDWDERVRELWGASAEEAITFATFREGIHPDDLPATEAAIARAMDPSGDGRYYAVYRVVHRIDRQTRWVEATGRCSFAEGRCLRLVGTVLDITRRKLAEQELLLAAERADVAQRAASAILFEYRPQTGVVFRSPRVEELLGYRPEEIAASADGWRSLIHSEDLPLFDAALARTLSDGTDLSLEYRVHHKQGHWLWVSEQARLTRNDQGEVERLVGLVSDITRRRQIQLALEESESRFRTVADACPTIIWVTNCAGENEFINQAYRDYCGLADDRILSFQWEKLVHPGDAPAYLEAFRQALLHQTAFQGRCRLRRADGQWRWMASTASPRFSADGTFLGHVGSSPDVHDLITAQQALEESEERFRTLADNMSQFAWMADGEGSLFWYNRRWYEYSGTTLAEMQGWGWRAIHHPDHVDRVVAHFRECLASGEPWEDTFPLRGKDGQYRWFLSRALPIRDAAGRIYRWFGTNTDITRQLDIERDLRRANADLEQFAYSASHDLQEPLRNVAVYSQLLEREYGAKLDERASLFLQQVGNGARRMSRLVSDLLAYSRTAELDGIPIERVDASRVIEQVRVSLSQAIKETGAELHYGPLPEVDIRPVHLELLFQNLVGNALKYRQDGQAPRVEVGAVPRTGLWEFSIRDNGIGIEPEYHSRIFGVFKRLHRNEQKYPGTGIGLAICQRIVESYGGRIWVESEAGRGSTFRFTLPISHLS